MAAALKKFAQDALRRSMSTSTANYPFSKTAIIPTITPPPSPALKQGKGIMAHLQRSLLPPEKQALFDKYFSRHSKERLTPGSIVQVTMEHAPTTFTGVLLAIRRRGTDTSFLLRNIIQRTGVEMQVFIGSPHLKDIKVVQQGNKRARRAKLYYLRDSPEKMSAISAGFKK